MNEKLKNALEIAIVTILLSEQIDKLVDSFNNPIKSQKVAEFLHQELKGTGPYLVNDVLINPDNIVDILEGLDELYKVYSIALSYTYPDYLVNDALTDRIKKGPLGELENSLAGFEYFHKNNKIYNGGFRVATLLILNPINLSEQNKLKSILEKFSVVFAFSANITGRPFFQQGQM